MVPFGLTDRRTALLATLAAAWMIGGCAEAARPGAGQSPAGGKPAARARSGGLNLNFSGGNYATVYTILCMEAHGSAGARLAESFAKGLRSVKGLDPNAVQIQTKGETSRLYYGAYKGEAKAKFEQFGPPKKALEDLAVITGMVSGQSQPFQLATVVEMPTPDPGPAEWNLKNAPGLYTLQICHCFDKPGLPNHKEVAVAICKALREQGEEAWYLHNDRVSVVTVGHFDESAVVKDADGKPVGYGPAVLALQNKREEFKHNTECLRKVVHVVGTQRIPAASVLIQIPRESRNDQPGSVRPDANSPARSNPSRYW